MENKLALRKTLKAKKPTFLKQDAHRHKRLDKNWRAPRGMHSKMRLKLRSYRKQPSVGYGSPREVRGLLPGGQQLRIVANVQELEENKDPIMIAQTVGAKKRVAIIEKAKELKIEILNVKDAEAYLKEIAELMKEKQKKAKERKSKKEKQKKKSEEKEEKKEKKEEVKKETPETPEEAVTKEKEAKEEKRKVLEKKT